MGIPLQDISFYDNGGGLNLKYSPTKVPEDESSLSLNIDYSIDGAFATRFGSTIMNATAGLPVQMAGAPKTLLISDYRNSAGTQVTQITAGTTIKHSLSNPINAVTGLDASLPYPDTEFFVTRDDEYLIWGNGVDTNLKFNGTTYTNLSMPQPAAITFGADQPPAGAQLPIGDYYYYVSFVRTVGGTIVQESELSPISAVHTLGAPQTIRLVVPVCTETLLPGVTAQCNGRVIYRRNITTGVVYRVTPGVTIADNVTTTYDDNASDAVIAANAEADFDTQATPTSKVFEEYMGRLFVVDAAQSTDVYYTPVNEPWNVRLDPILFDGPVRCIKRIFGALIFGTDRSIWVLNGDILAEDARRVSSAVGILNNRCAVGQDSGTLYIMATNAKAFALNPTDFSQSEIRFSEPLSLKVDPLFAQINTNDPEIPCMESYTSASVNKVMISVPLGVATNNTLIIYNESQAILKEKPVWQKWDNIKASALRQLTLSNDINLYSGDYNGFLWKLDDNTKNGDGAEINGTATSAGATTLTENLITSTATAGGANTLTDSTQAMTVNAYTGDYIAITGGTGAGQSRQIQSNTATIFTVSVVWGVVPDATSTYIVGPFLENGYVGMTVRIIDGLGENQVRTIISNTVDTLTVAAWTTVPDNTSEYTVGGYDVYHFSNWKYVVDSYDALKQLWFIWANANASGDYQIQVILQIDFDQSQANQIVALLTLAAANTIWGQFIWGQAVWGAFQVFLDRLRQFARFRAIRVGFMHRAAGQPFQINGFSLSVQDKKLFFRSAA
jgi:hypothetical protein